MGIAAPAPEREVKLAPDELIVSRTDPKGRIRYVNRTFMRVSGYSEPEIMGKPHNIIRHPDMPRGIFRLLWKTILAGEECFAYVKNRTRDGGYYWVFANVTADRNAEGEIIGFFSVRRRMPEALIPYFESLYARMRAAEAGKPASQAPEAGIAVLEEEIRNRGFDSYETFVLGIQA
ncbi:MAG: PAS domain-containing protein [Gammaproteobacteria bacterium]|nr:MAG: PAS domain-containing protein [Gammaproteobacteria bacterium]